MNKRLEHIYSKICPGKGVLDVGTDHGYIPVQLACNGYEGCIIASDIHQLPLNNAICNAEEAGVKDRLSFLLCDGIAPECLALVDTVVIAGMGGDTICHILDAAYDFIRADITFLLQPMSKPEILRYWLVHNGFTITDESLVDDSNHLYPVLSVQLDGGNTSLKDFELYTGPVELIKNSIYYYDLFNIYIKKFTRICRKKNGTDDLAASVLKNLREVMYKEN